MIKNDFKLNFVHPDLVKVVRLAATRCDFIVLEGLRTKAAQIQNLKTGHSQTLRSRHLDGHAVDLGVLQSGKLVWSPWSAYKAQSDVLKAAAKELNIPIEWGGDWKTLKDGPHFQLPWKTYP